jgi:hypothetical protein
MNVDLNKFIDWDILCSAYERAPDNIRAAVSNILTSYNKHAFLFAVMDTDVFTENLNTGHMEDVCGNTLVMALPEFVTPIFAVALSHFRMYGDSGQKMLIELLANTVSSFDKEGQEAFNNRMKELLNAQ